MIAPVEPAPKKRRRSRVSPTQRSLKLLRERGYLAEVVEKRIPFQFVTRDLYGCIDILALRGAETLAVQATTMDGGNAANREAKVRAAPALPIMLGAGWRVVVHGWRKLKSSGRWECREAEVTA